MYTLEFALGSQGSRRSMCYVESKSFVPALPCLFRLSCCWLWPLLAATSKMDFVVRTADQTSHIDAMRIASCMCCISGCLR